ncbi:MAG: CRISPR-associated protein Csx10, partial [Acidobacteriota bacterium]|nr:CRISPR-associated protein Csx10 [Acidobacteriota bacterium]
ISPDLLEMERQFLSFTTKSGFSGVWKLPRIHEHALKAGSVMVIKNNSGKTLERGKLSGHCFGIDTREGYGKIKISPGKKKDLTYEIYELAAPSLPPSEDLVKIQETIKRILLEHIKMQLKLDALRKAQKSQLPSNSFIGKIGMFINQVKTFEDLNVQFFSQLRDIGKKQLEKIEKHLFIEGVEKKQVNIEKVKKFFIDIKNKPEMDSPILRELLTQAGIDEHFFNDNETAFDLYKFYARLFLSSLRLVSRRKDEE